VWLAGSKENLIYQKGTAFYQAPFADSVHSPSIDALFFSLAQAHLAPRVGVLLSGMGRDGAAGLLALRKSRALTIAQDEATSVVYGMPKVAAEIGAAVEILPLSAIGPRIRRSILPDDPPHDSETRISEVEATSQPSSRAMKIPKTQE
jgi:two-component system response regulator WspF